MVEMVVGSNLTWGIQYKSLSLGIPRLMMSANVI